MQRSFVDALVIHGARDESNYPVGRESKRRKKEEKKIRKTVAGKWRSELRLSLILSLRTTVSINFLPRETEACLLLLLLPPRSLAINLQQSKLIDFHFAKTSSFAAPPYLRQ